MKAYVYWSFIPKNEFSAELKRVLECLPQSFLVPISKKQILNDQLASTVGKYLLKHCLGHCGISSDHLKNLVLDSNGRPYIPGIGDFNISHSGDIVVCAFCQDGRVGVDIEKIGKLKSDDLGSQLSLSQKKKIDSAINPARALYDLWTQCESVLKADGAGLSASLKDIELADGHAIFASKKWFLYPLTLEQGYAAYLATNNASVEISYHSPCSA